MGPSPLTLKYNYCCYRHTYSKLRVAAVNRYTWPAFKPRMIGLKDGKNRDSVSKERIWKLSHIKPS